MPASALQPIRPLEMFRLDGRTAIVTGASSGLGLRFARVLAEAGATVVACARRQERLETLAESMSGIVPVACDVTDDSSLDRLVERANDVGEVAILVNNAGSHVIAHAEDEPIGEFRRVVDLNLNSVFLLTQLVARGMLERTRGSIVNIASIMGLVASSPVREASYCASKGGVISLSRELAVQWADRGVRVNCIAPGWFPSELTAEMLADERSISWIERNAPMHRPGRETELDGALLFLASDASSYVTGQVLTVDGGWTAR